MEGFYYDPKHGGCLRRIVRIGTQQYILGVYGDDEPWPGESWYAVMRSTGKPGHWRVHFSGKVKRRKYYDACFVGRSLHWDDGNVWPLMFHHPSQLARRPAAPHL